MIRPLAIKSGERGSAAVEFAMAMPLLLGMIFCSFEMGRMFWVDQAINQALAQTARYAMINGDMSQGEITSYFRTLPNAIDPNAVTLSYTTDAVNDVPFITITATYEFEPISGIFDVGGITLTNRSRTPRTVSDDEA